MLYLCWQMLEAEALPACGAGLGPACNCPSIAPVSLRRKRLVGGYRNCSVTRTSKLLWYICTCSTEVERQYAVPWTRSNESPGVLRRNCITPCVGEPIIAKVFNVICSHDKVRRGLMQQK